MSTDPAVRQQAIDVMKQKLAEGGYMGDDVEELAEYLVDQAIKERGG